MSVSDTSTNTASAVDASRGPDLPGQRRSDSAQARAADAHQALTEAWAVLHRVVAELPEPAFRAPSRLPGWSKAHVVTHLARNADALVNLMTWARTGIEHPAYASRADRDADIAAGAERLAQVIREDLYAACDRFHTAFHRLSDAEWSATVTHPSGLQLVAAELPELALFEAWHHLVDLDAGVEFGDLPAAQLDRLLDIAVRPVRLRADGEPLRVVAQLPDGRQRTWELAIATQSSSAEVSGPAAAVLGWLTRRSDGSGLTGTPPELSAWA
ncbi:maleylpyruvate isomerase [Actinokineospora auranticolor]|uniref:Maleylpyruvate isomerase n=1 Tax=Actinokineospora auranticolor TaxID=155976 RepID=A0A2S6GNJ5_9PSEU|nr:maleylpyruvate isomerase [Actinokineospora auranticolor]